MPDTKKGSERQGVMELTVPHDITRPGQPGNNDRVSLPTTPVFGSAISAFAAE